MKIMKECRSTKRQLQKSRRDVKYSTGKRVSDTVITMRGAKWVADL